MRRGADRWMVPRVCAVRSRSPRLSALWRSSPHDSLLPAIPIASTPNPEPWTLNLRLDGAKGVRRAIAQPKTQRLMEAHTLFFFITLKPRVE